jgi:hypothetical protein
MKLKLELFRYGTLVFGRVLEQAEELRDCASVAKKGSFEIMSFDRPMLGANTLYILGSAKDCDDTIFHFSYGSEERAKGICEIIKELVAEINSDTDADLGGIVRVM